MCAMCMCTKVPVAVQGCQVPWSLIRRKLGANQHKDGELSSSPLQKQYTLSCAISLAPK